MSIWTRFNPISGFILGSVICGILGTYAQRYFGTYLVIGAILGLLLGQWSKNQREPDIEWIKRE
ncbi:MAG: hypothetical protein ACERKS_13230 [Candidatus Bathyarchaeota archaeon]